MNETNTSTSRPHLIYVDGMRALAALLVILNHAWQQIYWTSEPAQPWLRALSPLFSLGHYAVVAFLVVSGFCLMLPVVQHGSLRDGIQGFYKARALRILPAYYAALVLTLLLIATVIGQKHNVMYDISLPLTKAGVAAHFLMLHNLWPPPYFGFGGNTQIASIYWTIALECQIYLCFPVVVWLWKRCGLWLTLLVGFSVISVLYHLTGSRYGVRLNWQGFNFPFYAYFLIGVLAAHIVFSVSAAPLRALNWQWVAWGFIGAFGVSQVFGSVVWQADHIVVLELLTSLLTLAVLVAASKNRFNGLSWTPLLPRWASDAYSIYLLHLPLLAVVTDLVIVPLRDRIATPVQLGLLLGIGVSLTLFCAQQFSRVFEDKKYLSTLWKRIPRLSR